MTRPLLHKTKQKNVSVGRGSRIFQQTVLALFFSFAVFVWAGQTPEITESIFSFSEGKEKVDDLGIRGCSVDPRDLNHQIEEIFLSLKTLSFSMEDLRRHEPHAFSELAGFLKKGLFVTAGFFHASVSEFSFASYMKLLGLHEVLKSSLKEYDRLVKEHWSIRERIYRSPKFYRQTEDLFVLNRELIQRVLELKKQLPLCEKAWDFL